MDALDKEWSELLGGFFRTSGLNDIQGKVISVLYIQPNEISMEDLAKETGYSLASVSNAMKLPLSVGIVKRIKKPKTRKVFFYMEKNIFNINKQRINFAYEHFIKPMEESVPKLIEKYKKRAHDEKSKKKYKIIRNYYKQIMQFEEVLNHMLGELDKLSAKNRK